MSCIDNDRTTGGSRACLLSGTTACAENQRKHKDARGRTQTHTHTHSVLRNIRNMDTINWTFVGGNILAAVMVFLAMIGTFFALQLRGNRLSHSSAMCRSPKCVRCRLKKHRKQIDRLKMELMDFSDKSNVSELKLCRISALLETNTRDWQEWTGEQESPEHVVWIMRDLNSNRFWSFGDIVERLPDLEVLGSSTAVNTFRHEFDLAYKSESKGWLVTDTPRGSCWEVFHLLDQGQEVGENTAICPKTMGIIKSLTSVGRHTYSNVLFSVLHPGSEIEPHFGPCNFRLRCHIPLHAPEGYFIEVGKDIASWKENEVLVLNDSFKHRVWSETTDPVSVEEETVAASGVRVVLIVDIWHPDVEEHERSALECIFSSETVWIPLPSAPDTTKHTM